MFLYANIIFNFANNAKLYFLKITVPRRILCASLCAGLWFGFGSAVCPPSMP
jgi:hypothetical protein